MATDPGVFAAGSFFNTPNTFNWMRDEILASAKKVEAVNLISASGAAQTIPDPATYPRNDITLTSATCTLTFPTATTGKAFLLLVRQDAVGGRLIAWPAAVQWPGNANPDLTVTANSRDLFTFVCFASVWIGLFAGKAIS